MDIFSKMKFSSVRIKITLLLSLLLAFVFSTEMHGQNDEFLVLKFKDVQVYGDPDGELEYEGAIVDAEYDHKLLDYGFRLSKFEPQIASRFTPSVKQIKKLEKGIREKYRRASNEYIDEFYKPPSKELAQYSLDQQKKFYEREKFIIDLKVMKIPSYNRQYVGYINKSGRKCIMVNFITRFDAPGNLYAVGKDPDLWKKEYVESTEASIYLGFQVFYDVKKDRISLTAFHINEK